MAVSEYLFSVCFTIGRYGPSMIALIAMLSEERHSRRISQKQHLGPEDTECYQDQPAAAHEKGVSAVERQVRRLEGAQARRARSLENFHRLAAYVHGVIMIIAALVNCIESLPSDGAGVYVQSAKMCLMMLSILVVSASERVRCALVDDWIEDAEYQV